MNSKLVGLLLLACAVGGCSASLYMPTERDASHPGSLDALLRGRELYVRHCGSCHSLHPPERFSENRWREIMPDMQHRAKISDEDAGRVLQYVLTGIRVAENKR